MTVLVPAAKLLVGGFGLATDAIQFLFINVQVFDRVVEVNISDVFAKKL